MHFILGLIGLVIQIALQLNTFLRFYPLFFAALFLVVFLILLRLLPAQTLVNFHLLLLFLSGFFDVGLLLNGLEFKCLQVHADQHLQSEQENKEVDDRRTVDILAAHY